MTTSMNISLPDSLKDYVKTRCAEGEYSNPSDFIRALIRDDKKRRGKERLEEMLLEGLASGHPVAMDDECWKEKRPQLLERYKQEQ